MKKLIILIITFILSFTGYYNQELNNDDNIYIKKINLHQNFSSYKKSNVDKGIIYLKESDFSNNFYILAAHSGNSNISYFKNIHKLTKGDIIVLTVNNRKIEFIVDDMYYVKKTGKIIIKKNKHTLYLTTCDKYNNNRQLIIKCVKKV